MNTTNINRTGEAMPEGTITSLFSLVVAIFAVGGMVGGLAAGWWADFFGRYVSFFLFYSQYITNSEI